MGKPPRKHRKTVLTYNPLRHRLLGFLEAILFINLWQISEVCSEVGIMLLLTVLFSQRYDSNSGGEREIQRTMLELLNQLDGFDSRGDVKVIMATNRIETLDPALIRPGKGILVCLGHCSCERSCSSSDTWAGHKNVCQCFAFNFEVIFSCVNVSVKSRPHSQVSKCEKKWRQNCINLSLCINDSNILPLY